MAAKLPMVTPTANVPAPPRTADDLVRWANELTRALSDTHSKLAYRTEDMLRAGLEAELPPANGVRRIFLAEDTKTLWLDKGTWIKFLSTTSSGANFAWYEVPTGTLATGQLAFTLAHTPTAEPLILMGRRGCVVGTDYNRAGTALTFVSGHEPADSGDPLYAFYPY